MKKIPIYDLDTLSDDYVVDFEVFDKYTHLPVFRRYKVRAKLAMKSLLDFFTRK